MIITPHSVEDFPSSVVQPSSFGRIKPYSLEDAVASYTYETEYIRLQRVSKKEGINQALALVNNPFKRGLHLITSEMQADRPNLLASMVARRAHHLYNQGYPKTRRSRYAKPEFSYISASFSLMDKLHRQLKAVPILLVISGLDYESTSAKWDYCRDIINTMSRYDTSIVLVSSGCTPHQLEHECIRMEATSHILINYDNLSKQALI